MGKGLAQTAFAARGDQIGDRLSLGKVDAAVEKGTAAELAGVGVARAGGHRERDNAADQVDAAMAMKFGNVFTGETLRPRHRDTEGAVDGRAGLGVADFAEIEPSRDGRSRT